MAQLRENRHQITGSPVSSGLDLSAGRDSVDETQLWEVEGLYADENKALSKRPTFVTWATQIVEPTSPVPADDEEISEVFFINEADWGAPSTSGESVSAVYDNGAIVLAGWETSPAGSGSASIERTFKAGEGFNGNGGYDGSFTISFVIQAKSPPLGEFAKISVAGEVDKLKVFTITSAGLGYKTGASTFAVFTGSGAIVDGESHRVDIKISGGVAFEVFIDGASIGSAGSSHFDTTSDYFAKISAVSDDTLDATPYSITISSFIYRDTVTSPFSVPSISDMQTVRELKASAFSDINSLLMASEGYLWVDYGLKEIWRPVIKLPRNLTRFTKFRGNTIICNYSEGARKTEVYQYDLGVIELLDNAPDMRFTTEYTNRVWGAGDANHPLRLYFSGDRQPNLWYNPSDPNIVNTEDLDKEAGFIEFPGDDKARIRLIHGDFFGMLLVATDKDVWVITGTSPADYTKRRISGALSASGDLCGIDVFNDYWLLGNDGISSIQTTDKFGDVEGKRISVLARELFNTDNPSGRMLDPEKLYKTRMVYYSKLSTMLFASDETAKEESGVIYAMNVESRKWSGPWREQSTAMRIVTLASPIKDMVAIGTADGYVKYMSVHVSNTDALKLSSPVITGRSIDEKFDTMKKTWKAFRLKIRPTGNWDIVFRWKTDDREWKTLTRKLSLPSHPLLGSTATTGTSFAKSAYQPMIIEFPIDVRGESLKYEITSSAPRAKFLRWEIDFVVDGHERD